MRHLESFEQSLTASRQRRKLVLGNAAGSLGLGWQDLSTFDEPKSLSKKVFLLGPGVI